MNRINFNNYGGGIFHHLTPYSKKKVQPEVVFEEVLETILLSDEQQRRNVIKAEYDNVFQALPDFMRFAPNENGGFRPTVAKNPCTEIKLESPTEEKLKKLFKQVTVLNNPTEYKHKRGFRIYHKHQTFTYQEQSLSVSDSIGGCGMQQFYGWADTVHDEEIASILIQHYIRNRHNGVGLIICQLGQTYYGNCFEKALIKNGFKVLSEYKNFMHGNDGKYSQRVYGLELTIASISRNEKDN